MGRKSRYKKYKAVDPFCTGERKEKLLRNENVFNRAPQKEEFEQKPPKGFLELMNSIEESQRKEKQVRKRKKEQQQAAENGREKKKGKYERRPWESDDQFLARVDRNASRIINSEKMEILKSGGDKEEAPKKLTKEKERKLKRIKKTAVAARKKKEEEQKEYAEGIKQDRMLESLEKEMQTDSVQFGEVAMEPPTLTKAPRKSTHTAKPGQRELLLKGMIAKNTQAPTSTPTPQNKKAVIKQRKSELLNKKKERRRKNMSASEKIRFDQVRSDVIEAYRKQRNTERITLPVLSDDPT